MLWILASLTLQSDQNRTNASTLEELSDAANDAFDRSESISLDNVWITLQPCMEEIMESEAENDYKILLFKKTIGS